MQLVRRRFIVFIIGFVIILFWAWSLEVPPPPILQKTYSLSDYMEPPKLEIRARDWDMVGVYYNLIHHYTVEYPAAGFIIKSESKDPKYDQRGIDFGGIRDPRRITIITESTTATSALQAFLDVKDGMGRNEYIFEKMITIDKYPAAMGHLYWNGVEIPDVKMVYFIKDRELYTILSEYVDHERVWNSFRFEE